MSGLQEKMCGRSERQVWFQNEHRPSTLCSILFGMEGQSPPLEEGGETWPSCLGRRLSPVFFVVMAPEMNLVGPNGPLGNWVDSRPLTAFGRLKRLLTVG